MKLTIEKEYEYIPAWNDNEKEADPITIKMRALTEFERDKVITQRYVEGGLETTTNKGEAIRRGVVSIENLFVNNQAVKTAKDLLDTPGVTALISEIATEVILRSAKKDLGNSK